MPRNKYSLRFEHIFRFDDHFSIEFPIMSNFSYHVIDIEWFTQVVFVVSIGHGSEMNSHHRSTLNIPKLVEPCCCVAISVEELGKSRFIFREIRVVEPFVIFLMIINDVPCLWGEVS